MADDAGSAGQTGGGQVSRFQAKPSDPAKDKAEAQKGEPVGRDSNAHISAAAREAAGRSGELPQKVADAIREEGEAGAKASAAAQKAAPTGKDIPEIAAENIKGHQTAVSRPDQPKSQDDLRATGAQREPALIAKDGGSIPHGMVSSPTGLVPAASLGNPAEALARYGESVKKSIKDGRLTEEQLSGMNKHEIRAVAHDRGYKIGEGSQRSLTSRFLEAQSKADREAEK